MCIRDRGKAVDISEVREIMGRLGVTPNYKGFYYTVYAVCLVADKPERLLLVTKWLYPEVARHYETTVNAVERDIRTVVGIMWNENRKALEEIFRYRITTKPTVSQFLAMITSYLLG